MRVFNFLLVFFICTILSSCSISRTGGRNDFKEENKKNAQLRNEAGKKFFDRGKYSEALVNFEAAIKLDENAEPYLKNAADTAILIGKKDKAASWIKKIVIFAVKEKQYEKIEIYNNKLLVLRNSVPDWADKILVKSKFVPDEKLQVEKVWKNNFKQIDSLIETEKLEEAYQALVNSIQKAENLFGVNHYNSLIAGAKLGEFMFDYAEPEQAAEFYLDLSSRYTQILGEGHPESLKILRSLSEVYLELNKDKAVLELNLKLRSNSEKYYGKSHYQFWKSSRDLALYYLNLGDYRHAEKILSEQQVSLNKYLGIYHPLSIETETLLGRSWQLRGNISKAEARFETALERSEKIFGVEDETTLEALANLADSYRIQARYKEAESLLIKTIKISKRLVSPDNPVLLESMVNLAKLNEEQGDFLTAEKLYLAVWQRERLSLGDDHPNTIGDLNNLAGIYSKMGKLSLAEKTYLRSLNRMEKVLGNNHPETLTIMNNLALVYEKQGLYDEAEPLYRKAFSIAKKTLGKENPRTIAMMNNIAALYESQGAFIKAEPLYRKSIEINSRLKGNNHPQTMAIVNNLAYLYLIEEKYKEAEPLFDQVYNVWKKKYTLKHQWTLKALNNKARVYHYQKKYHLAEPLFIQALTLRKEVMGKEHPDSLRSMNDFAALKISQKKYKSAEKMLIKALKISERSIGKLHPYTFEILNNLVKVLKLQNKLDQAFKFASKGFKRRTEFLDRILWVAGENTREAYIKLFNPEKQTFMTILAELGGEEQAKAAFRLSLERKGLLLKISSEIQKIARLANSPGLTKIVDELRVTKKELASLTLSGPTNHSTGNHLRQINKLEEKINDLERNLGRASLTYREQGRDISPDQVLAKLGNGTLVDYLYYNDGEPKIMAIVVKNNEDQPFKLIKLGNLKPIQQIIREFRESIQEVDGDLEEIMEIGNEVYRKVWEPLADYLPEEEKVYIVPDSILNILPFEALVNHDEDYLIQAYNISIISSARDLVLERVSKSKGSLMIFAGPDYNSDYLKGTAQLTQAITKRSKRSKRSAVSLEIARGLRIASSGLRGLSFDPLPGAEKEGEVISYLSKSKGYKTSIYLKKIAEEKTLRNSKTSPEILHIATHGFFLKESETLAKRLIKVTRGGSADLIPPPGDNPLLRSGLAFAGINANAKFLGEVDTDNDGILTAMEVLGLNLEGTNLVILSACETGLGEIHDGEGVYGLRRSFQESGVPNIINSLWEVSDDGTQHLMSEFYRKLLKGENTHDAIKNTKLTMIDSEKWFHPFYWSAFVLVEKK